MIWLRLLFLVAIGLVTWQQIGFDDLSGAAHPGSGRSASPALSGIGHGPCFVENRGQWPEHVRFQAQFPGLVVQVERTGLGLILTRQGQGYASDAYLRLEFEATSDQAAPEGVEELDGRYSYFFGDDPEQWVPEARSFSAVRFRGLYPGIDLLLRGEGGRLKYDLYVDPGADLSRVAVRCEGIEGLYVDEGGVLELATVAGSLHQLPGTTWQVASDKSRELLDCHHVLLGTNRFGFEVAGWDVSLPLVIDPELKWSTYIGSARYISTGDSAWAVATDTNGDVVVAGWTDGFDFPTTPGSFQKPSKQFGDIFVTRFRGEDGEILQSSVLGGSSHQDRPMAVALDARGRITVAGNTDSKDFPVTPGAFDTVKDHLTLGGFVLRFNADQTQLEYSTHLESSWGMDVQAVEVDRETGAAVVAGLTIEGHPITPGSFQEQFGGNADGFVTRFNSSGSSLTWSTYLGGSGMDQVSDLHLDEAGNVVVTGFTRSTDFPTTPGTLFPDWPGQANRHAFVTVLASTGDHLLWSTYLGASGDSGGEVTIGAAVEFGPRGDVIVCGNTSAENFPTTPGAFQTQRWGLWTSFVSRVTSDGANFVYSTFLDSPYEETGHAQYISVDCSGVATVGGGTIGQYLVTRGAFDTDHNGGVDAFVARLNPSGTKLLYSTHLGGGDHDRPLAISMSRERTVSIVGYTSSYDFPTTPGAYSEHYIGGQSDAFVTTFDLLLDGVQSFGYSTPSCKGLLAANVTRIPADGSANFAFDCSGAPPRSKGWLVIGTPAAAATNVGGARVWIDLGKPVQRIPVASDQDGYLEVPFPIPAGSQGRELSCQFLFENTLDCQGIGRLCASNGLTITVQ